MAAVVWPAAEAMFNLPHWCNSCHISQMLNFSGLKKSDQLEADSIEGDPQVRAALIFSGELCEV